MFVDRVKTSIVQGKSTKGLHSNAKHSSIYASGKSRSQWKKLKVTGHQRIQA